MIKCVEKYLFKCPSHGSEVTGIKTCHFSCYTGPQHNISMIIQLNSKEETNSVQL